MEFHLPTLVLEVFLEWARCNQKDHDYVQQNLSFLDECQNKKDRVSLEVARDAALRLSLLARDHGFPFTADSFDAYYQECSRQLLPYWRQNWEMSNV
ncbi:hypothetical protein [Tengunoibacter tsumagoiensis]|uniref:Uncharacterized protein n=1 Tax=Tengunoibacter tsumagoiensis TaxID=2014871 RepID=A0A401ZZ74_9CHLR|nr:hypothetical protein [Tengunoibacter tsumagoiensis]GCE12122.1 hypothetical protein KTT_19810 [Tengunoibacter tsumagoiensis]